MYPKIKSAFYVKGVIGEYFVFDLDTFAEYPLNDVQTEVLRSCTGTNSIGEIGRKHNLLSSDVAGFLGEMVRLGCVEYASIPVRHGVVNFSAAVAPYLHEVHFDSTTGCNLHCLTCYQEPYLYKTSATDLSSTEVKALLRQLTKLGVARFILSGGEPFLRRDIEEIIVSAFAGGIAVPTIFTNGTVHRFDVIRTICALGRPITFAISLDGSSPNENDYIRGTGRFKQTIRFIEYLLAERGDSISRTRIVIDTVIHPRNFRSLRLMYELLSRLGVDRWRVALPRNQGAYQNNTTQLSLEEKDVLSEYEKFIAWYLEQRLQYNNPDVQIESFFRSSALRGIRQHIFTEDSFCCEYKRAALTIKPNGDVTSCTAFTNLVVGNVRHNPIGTIWYSEPMQKLKQLRVGDVEGCRGCEYLYLCGTGCRSIALRNTGFLTSKDQSACGIYSFFHHRIIPLIQSFFICVFIPYINVLAHCSGF